MENASDSTIIMKRINLQVGDLREKPTFLKSSLSVYYALFEKHYHGRGITPLASGYISLMLLASLYNILGSHNGTTLTKKHNSIKLLPQHITYIYFQVYYAYVFKYPGLFPPTQTKIKILQYQFMYVFQNRSEGLFFYSLKNHEHLYLQQKQTSKKKKKLEVLKQNSIAYEHCPNLPKQSIL